MFPLNLPNALTLLRILAVPVVVVALLGETPNGDVIAAAVFALAAATDGLDGYFAALDMIKADPKKSFEIMGADVKQSGEAFEKSQAYLRWQDRAANQKFFAGEHAQFSKEAADLLLEIGIIKQLPDLKALADTSFIK